MPRSWHDRHSVNCIEDPDVRKLYKRIVADKKPYFMRLIYPDLMRQYNTYIANTNKNALREFQMTIDELCATPAENQTERQREFLYYFNSRLPVGTGDCVMNRICRRFEEEFDGYLCKHNKGMSFDYTIMKSFAEYSRYQYDGIQRLYEEYNKRTRSYAVFARYERLDECDVFVRMQDMQDEFRNACTAICPNSKVLCDIVLDLCYRKSSTKRFAWEMCGSEIIDNLLEKNNRIISYPVRDLNGNIRFCGEKFTIEEQQIGVGV